VNHFISLVIFSLAVAGVFALLNREGRRNQLVYFLTLLGYMIGGSLLLAWIMYFLPW
jgi:hypothetical protein